MEFTTTTEDKYLRLAKQVIPSFSEADLKDQSFIPALAKDELVIQSLRHSLQHIETTHKLYSTDSRSLSLVQENSVHLVVTSPPYWTLKQYNKIDGQLGYIEDFNAFNNELEKVWEEMFRILVPGGRLVIVVGDVSVSRRTFGRHLTFPLHASIQEKCRAIGFDNLTPIIWNKIANANFEANGGGFLGKPYEPNAIIKNDIEYILMQRKSGKYRSPSLGMRLFSIITDEEHKKWFQPIWRISGTSNKEHPAPYPLKLAERLIRMFSFAGDTILDPFVGTGTTSIAAQLSGRNSIGIDIDPNYLTLAQNRFQEKTNAPIELHTSM